MNIHDFIPLMEENARRIEQLVTGIPAEDAHWRPEPGAWSLVEVVNHLCDEEKEDFRVRLDIILHHPQKKWPPIDPGGWVRARDYNARALGSSLDNFLQERERSLAWLPSLSQAAWETEYQAPFGSIRAGDMLAAWATHDLHHMRQLVEILHALALDKATPYSGRYAGEW